MTDYFYRAQKPNRRLISRWLPGFLILVLSLAAVRAEEPAPAAADMKVVLERLAKLEAEVASLRAQLAEKNAAQPAGAAIVAAGVPAAATAPAKAAEKKPLELVTNAGVKGTLYGFVQLDTAYDSAKMNSGNLALWVDTEKFNSNDSQWAMTGNVSRLGIDFSGPEAGDLALSGKVEGDFLGGGAENATNPRMRHAYLKAFWADRDFSVLAGQTWDLNSALIPPVLNPGLLWYAGNLGRRHPQLRVTKGFKLGDQDRLELGLAAARNLGEDDATWTLSTVNNDTGRDAKMPTLQYRVAYSRPLLVDKVPAMIAVSGHYGQEEWDLDKFGADDTVPTWSSSLELDLPITAKLGFAGELFTGTNLDDYTGGIGQGVTKIAGTPNDVKPVSARGGWLALKFKPATKTVINLGAGMDDPDDEELADDTRSRNAVAFINFTQTLAPNLKLGFELSQWQTEYKNSGSGDATRLQSSLNYSF